MMHDSIPQPARIRQLYLANPTASSRLLLSLLYFAALMQRSPKVPLDEEDMELKRQALCSLITADIPTVMATARMEATTIHALTLLGTVDPLGLLQDTAQLPHTARTNGSANTNVVGATEASGRIDSLPTDPFRAHTMLASTLLQRLPKANLGGPEGIPSTEFIDLKLNELLLTVGDRIVQPCALDLSDLGLLPLIEGYHNPWTYFSQSREEDLRRLGEVLLKYRLAILQVYVRAVQSFGVHVERCCEQMRTKLQAEADWPGRMKVDLDQASNTMEDLQNACELSMTSPMAAEIRESQEMFKLCKMEQNNLRGCLFVFFFRAALWPFVEPNGLAPRASPFATSAMVMEQCAIRSDTAGNGDEAARRAAHEHGLNQQRVVSLIIEVARRKEVPSVMTEDVASRIRGMVSRFVTVRMESAETTLATFADSVQSSHESAPFLGWAPQPLLCTLLVDAAKVLMEAQVTTCAHIGQEVGRSSVWSFLMRRAADALDSYATSLPRRSSRSREGTVDKSRLLESLPSIFSAAIRDMDAVALRAQNAVRQKRLLSRKSYDGLTPSTTTSTSDSRPPGDLASEAAPDFRASRETWQPAVPDSASSSASSRQNIWPQYGPGSIENSLRASAAALGFPEPKGGTIHDDNLAQSWAQDPFGQLFAAWNDVPWDQALA